MASGRQRAAPHFPWLLLIWGYFIVDSLPGSVTYQGLSSVHGRIRLYKPLSSPRRRSLISAPARRHNYSITETGVDLRLDHIVQKHVTSLEAYLDNYEVSDFNREAYMEALEFARKFHAGRPLGVDLTGPLPIILDSGCGRGMSTEKLATLNTDIPVIGVDRSFVRLTRGSGGFREASTTPSNMLLLRAELADFWRLIASDGRLRVVEHYILYPNPYPKRKQLLRRWHGHPVFPLLLSLDNGEYKITQPTTGFATSPTTIVRSDWQTYLQEFERAWQTAGNAMERLEPREKSPWISASAKSLVTVVQMEEEPLTHFEAKFKAVGRPVYELRVGKGNSNCR